MQEKEEVQRGSNEDLAEDNNDQVYVDSRVVKTVRNLKRIRYFHLL